MGWGGVRVEGGVVMTPDAATLCPGHLEREHKGFEGQIMDNQNIQLLTIIRRKNKNVLGHSHPHNIQLILYKEYLF